MVQVQILTPQQDLFLIPYESVLSVNGFLSTLQLAKYNSQDTNFQHELCIQGNQAVRIAVIIFCILVSSDGVAPGGAVKMQK